MKHPDAFTFVLLALAAFRLTRLLGWDDISIPLRRRVTGVSDQDHHRIAGFVDAVRQEGGDPWDRDRVSGDPIPVGPARFYFGKMIRCPWCQSVYTVTALWIAWQIWPHASTWICVPLAIAAIVGLVAKQWDA